MTTNNIFGNDILSGDLNTSLVPELGQEDISLNITPQESSYTDPLTQELSLIESEIVLDDHENSVDNNSSNNFNSINNIVVSNIDPFIGGDVQEFQVNEVDVNDTSFAPPQSQLQFQGGFGDYDGGNDVTLEIKDTDGNVVETFALRGEGQATLYRDEEYQYVFFSGVDETTNVDISSTSNIKFGNYIGDSLKIETSGSIDGESVSLTNPDETGLVLKSGIEGEIDDSVIIGYDYLNLGFGAALDINNLGEVVGLISANPKSRSNRFDNLSPAQDDKAFIYKDNTIQIIDHLDGYTRSIANAINDLGQVAGYSRTNDIYSERAFFYDGTDTIDLGVIPGTNQSFARGINNSGHVVGTSRDTISRDELSKDYVFLSEDSDLNIVDSVPLSRLGYITVNDVNNVDEIRIVGGFSERPVGSYGPRIDAFIVSEGQYQRLGILPGYSFSVAYGVNNLGQVVGKAWNPNYSNFPSRAFIYDEDEMQSLGVLPGGDQSIAYDVNDLGKIVGSSSSTDGNRAVIYDREKIIDLNDWIEPDDGIILKQARAINNQGQIVGHGRVGESMTAFLLNPIYGASESKIQVGNISTFGDTVLLQGNEITLSGNAITTTGGKITFDGATTVNGNLTIDSSVTEDEVITDGGDITFTNTLDGSQNLTFKAGTGNVLFSDTVGGEATFFDVAVKGAGSVTINNDLAINGNLSLEVINDITTANLSAAGLVNISLGKVGDEIYPSTGNVTTGNIDAKGLEVLNNGNFTAGDLTTTDGDIDVISLNQLNVAQLTANNGAVDLISGTGGITVNGTVQGDNGFIALAQQDIVTNEITSSQDAVILKSSQGAVTVNGSVTAFGDASLAAAGNLTVGAVTSNDEGVALISGKETVAVNGTIVAGKDISIGAKKKVTTQSIKSKYGGVGLVSNRQSVIVRGEISSDSDLEILARRNIVTRKITSQGEITLESEQGKARIYGTMKTSGGDIYVSSVGDIATRTIVSRGGNITLVSSKGGMKTEFIRSNRGKNGGQVHLQAYDTIQIAGSRNINGTEYSIYTGIDNNEESIIINYQTGITDKLQRLDFVVGDASTNGAKQGFKFVPTYIYKFVSKKLLFAAPVIGTVVTELVFPQSTAPRHQSEINPLTGQPYADEAEFELVKKFTISQKRKLKQYLNDERYQLEFDYIKKRGKFDNQDRGCYGLPLIFHLGGNAYHDQYAEDVTSSPGDFLILPPAPVSGLAFMFYDGIVLAGSRATSASPAQSIGSLAEVKTGYEAFNYIANGNPRPQRTGRNGRQIKSDMQLYNEVVDEVIREGLIAKFCNKDYFVSFDRRTVANNARLLLNSDPRILASGLSNIDVIHINSRPLIRF